MNNQTVVELAASATTKLRNLGFSEGTVCLKRDRHYKTVVKYFREQGTSVFVNSILDSFLSFVDAKEGVQWKHHYCCDLKRAARQIKECHDTGSLVFHPYKGRKEFNPSYQFLSLVDQAVAEKHLKPDFHFKIVGVLRRFCCWIESHEVPSFSALTKEHIFEYFQNPDGKRARGTIAYDIFSIKLLLKYLDRTGVLTLPFDPSVLKPVKNGRRLIPPFTREELERLLGGIDRDTPSGKRNYAILLLGLTTGIRAGDVVNIKLQDIDWHRYELSVVQGKTSKRLVIPLEPATGNAIGDYILTRRPKSDSLHLFLTANAPYRKLKNSSALVTVLDDCSKKAGILKIPSRSFHSLRRSLGTFMSNSGVSIHTIAQVLGHSDLSTANRYISADMHLVDCALDFDGIPVGSGVL